MPVRALMPQTLSLLSLDRMTFDRHSSLALPLRVTRMHARELFVRPRARLWLCCLAVLPTSPGKAPRRSLAAVRHTISSVERSS